MGKTHSIIVARLILKPIYRKLPSIELIVERIGKRQHRRRLLRVPSTVQIVVCNARILNDQVIRRVVPHVTCIEGLYQVLE
jgi:hypothetical protein